MNPAQSKAHPQALPHQPAAFPRIAIQGGRLLGDGQSAPTPTDLFIAQGSLQAMLPAGQTPMALQQTWSSMPRAAWWRQVWWIYPLVCVSLVLNTRPRLSPRCGRSGWWGDPVVCPLTPIRRSMSRGWSRCSSTVPVAWDRPMCTHWEP